MGGGRVGYEGAAGLPAEETYERGEVDVADRRVAVPGCRRHQALELGPLRTVIVRPVPADRRASVPSEMTRSSTLPGSVPRST